MKKVVLITLIVWLVTLTNYCNLFRLRFNNPELVSNDVISKEIKEEQKNRNIYQDLFKYHIDKDLSKKQGHLINIYNHVNNIDNNNNSTLSSLMNKNDNDSFEFSLNFFIHQNKGKSLVSMFILLLIVIIAIVLIYKGIINNKNLN